MQRFAASVHAHVLLGEGETRKGEVGAEVCSFAAHERAGGVPSMCVRVEERVRGKDAA